jgi:thiol-disulfide isomerase/thioredoxin
MVFDRPGNRVRIDMPHLLIVVDGQKLYCSMESMPGKHLQIDAITPLTAEWLVREVEVLMPNIVPADLILLCAEDPLTLLGQSMVGGFSGGAPAMIPPDPDDELQRPRIELVLQSCKLILTINPQTFLVDQARIEYDTTQFEPQKNISSMSCTFDIAVNSTEAVDDERFAFDTTGSIASPSMQHMMASGSNAPHPLTGKPTPELKLPDIDGNEHDLAVDDADAKVIVLDFWATWCGPCVAALPELQEVYDWAQAEGKSVAIYAVNQGETVDEVKQFWADKGLSIPVLMDENFTGGQAFMVSGIPQTVVICGGKVRQVHVGYGPGMAGRLKAEIETLLAE